MRPQDGFPLEAREQRVRAPAAYPAVDVGGVQLAQQRRVLRSPPPGHLDQGVGNRATVPDDMDESDVAECGGEEPGARPTGELVDVDRPALCMRTRLEERLRTPYQPRGGVVRRHRP